MLQKRPILVWLIAVFYGLGALWTLLSFALFFSGRINVPPAEAAYFASLTPIDLTLTVLLAISGLVGAIMLFRLKRSALVFFLIALVLNISYSIWTFLMNPAFRTVAQQSVIGLITGLTVVSLITFYVYRLKKRGLLQE